MSRRKPKTGPSHLAAELTADDGQDPKEFHDKPWNQPKQASRKARQLCDQVMQALAGIFAASADEVLLALTVDRVEPAPNTGRLRVTLSLPGDADFDREVVYSHLTRAMGWLRSEAAGAIHRRYAPELVFDVIR